MLNVQQNLSTVPIIPDQRMQRIAERHPPDQSGVRRQRDSWIPLDAEMTLECFGIVKEQRIDKPEQLHHALVLT